MGLANSHCRSLTWRKGGPTRWVRNVSSQTCWHLLPAFTFTSTYTLLQGKCTRSHYPSSWGPLKFNWEVRHTKPALQEDQIVHQEAFLPQQLGFELAIQAPSEWLEICRLRCALRRGHGPRDAPTDTMSHLAIRLAAAHSGSCPFSIVSGAGQVGL